MYARTNPLHPRANSKGLYPLHRVLVENRLGRLLMPGEDVHHVDGDRHNNATHNLAVLSHAEHASLHANRFGWETRACGHCRSQMEIAPRDMRRRLKQSTSGNLYCSLKCASLSREAGRR